jgi:hypothetical protein
MGRRRRVFLVARDASFGIGHTILDSFVDWDYLGNSELAHALYATNAGGYFWYEI